MKFSTVQACGALASLSAAQAFVATPGVTFSRTLANTNTASCARHTATEPMRMMAGSTDGSEYTASLPGAPFGMAAEGKYFDPAGLAAKQDPQVVKKWREAELKHGRVAMLASLGILVAEVRIRGVSTRFPFGLSCILNRVASRIKRGLHPQYSTVVSPIKINSTYDNTATV